MNATNFISLALVVLGLSAGQILFKFSGRSIAASDSFIRGLLSPYLFAALFLYGIMTILWVWQLSNVDLNRAYPIMALTFVVVPLLSILVLGETISTRYWVGIAFIVVGIIVIQVEF